MTRLSMRFAKILRIPTAVFMTALVALSLSLAIVPAFADEAVMGSDGGDQDATTNVVVFDSSADNDESSSEDVVSTDEDSDDNADALATTIEFVGNSWRYLDGVPRNELSDNGVSLLSVGERAGGISWTKQSDGTYLSSNGVTVKGATGIGIDVSEHNGNIDWAKVKASGIDFAIIRLGFGNARADYYFEQNVKGCQDNDIPFGVYLYSYSYGADPSKGEAALALEVLSDAGLTPADVELGVWYDLENEKNGKPTGVKGDTNVTITGGAPTFAAMAKAFCNTVSAEGYEVGVYANRNWFTNYLTDSVFDSWPRWVADYTGTGSSKYTGDYAYWQCMSTGKVNGVSGYVDINFSYTGSIEAIVSAETIDLGEKVVLTPRVTGISSCVFNYVWANEGWSEWSSTFRETGGYTTLQSWEFTPSKPGVYTIGVDAITPDGKKYSSTKTLKVAEGWSLTAVNAGNGYVETPVEVSAEISGINAPTADLSFNFGWAYEGKFETWSSILNDTGSYSKSKTWSFIPEKAGTYLLFVDAISSNGLKETRSIEIEVTRGWTFGHIDSSSDRVDLGKSVVIKPSVTGVNSASVEFNYGWAYQGKFDDWSSTYKETGQYTADTSYSFCPSKAGTYLVFVDVICGSEKVTRQLEVNVTSKWNALALVVSDDGPTYVGDTVVVKTAFDDNSNLTGLKYNYIWRYGNDWSDWDSLLKNGSGLTTSNYFEFKPKKAGTYHLYVDVFGTDGYKQTISTDLSIILPYSINGLSISNSSITLGDSIAVSAMVNGDDSGLTYNFGYCFEGKYEDWDSTIKSSGVSTSINSWEFKPKKFGTYLVFVDVYGIDGNKTTFKDSIEVKSGWSIVGSSIDKSSPQFVGAEIGMRVQLSGTRTDHVEFNFVWQRDIWEDWSSQVKAGVGYTSDSSFTFTPKHSGHYYFYVDCRDKLSGQVLTLTLGDLEIKKTWSLEGLDLDYSWPVHTGAGITGTAVVAGSTEGLKFNFVWQRDGWSDWNSNLLSGGYTTNSTMTWSPISKSGVYSFYVDVIDKNGEIESAKVSGIRVASPSEIINRIEDILGGEKVNKSTYGYKYENAIVAAGGQLCANKHGKWCAAFLWWGFDKAGYRGLWGTSGLHVQSDPEYLAHEYQDINRYYSGTVGIKRGDLLFMRHTPWRPGQKITHVGYVTKVTSTSITVIEGNMSWGPYHTYDRYLSKFIGYARPLY